MRPSLVSIALLTSVLSLSAVACGGTANQESKTATTKASLELEPIDELKAIPADLDADVKGLTKPVDDVQGILDDLEALPKKYKLTKTQLMAMAKASFDSGKVAISADLNVADDAKAEIKSVLERLVAVVSELKATPDKVAALTKKTVAVTAKVPVLATKVTASATTTVSNPFAGADAKAKAQANIDSVKQVQADVSKSVSDVQGKITGIPQMATKALAKITTTIGAS